MEFDDILTYLRPFIFNLIEYLLFAGLAFLIFYVFFPKRFETNKIQSRKAKHKEFYRDVLHSLMSTLVISLIALVIIHTPLVNYSKVYLKFSDYSLAWFFISSLIAVLMVDAYVYWVHRIMHHNKLYKRFHFVHHKSTNPSPWTSYSFHMVESIFESLIFPALLFIIPLHTDAVLILILLSLTVNIYSHLGYEVAPLWFRKTIFFKFLTTSVYHNLHHEKFYGNYGFYFRFWDRLMGTERKDYVKSYDKIQRQRLSHKVRRADTRSPSQQCSKMGAQQNNKQIPTAYS